MSSAERDKVWAVRHEWGGDKVHSLVLDMSGFYVKSAQILATKAVSLSSSSHDCTRHKLVLAIHGI